MSRHPRLTERTRSGISFGAGLAVAVVLVLTVFVSGHPGWGFLSHSQCESGPRLGNVTAWTPRVVVAAPYGGSESGTLIDWTNHSWGRAQIVFHPYASSGNVTAWEVYAANWTIYSERNVSVTGIGPQVSCNRPYVAILSAPSLGGGAIYLGLASGLRLDQGLPTELNASQLCTGTVNPRDPTCAISAVFDINFSSATGAVDTCGSEAPQSLNLTSQAMPVTIPFTWNGMNYSIPTNELNNATGGTVTWYNYTFPANGGVWQYDKLADTSSTGAGLVFSYSPCP